jgi:uncharacterized protein (DUF4415 family)
MQQRQDRTETPSHGSALDDEKPLVFRSPRFNSKGTTTMAYDRTRRPLDAVSAAEAAFKKVTTKPVETPAAKPAVPGAKELVSLRLDQDVLQYFQADGPGWQDRINAVLRAAAGM